MLDSLDMPLWLLTAFEVVHKEGALLVAVLQLVIAWQLLRLQHSRERVEVEATISRDVVRSESNQTECFLQIANLGAVGVWVEKVVLRVESPAGSVRPERELRTERVIPPHSAHAEHLTREIRVAIGSLADGSREIACGVVAVVHFRAKGKSRTVSSAHYEVNLNDRGAQRVDLVTYPFGATSVTVDPKA